MSLELNSPIHVLTSWLPALVDLGQGRGFLRLPLSQVRGTQVQDHE